MSLEHTFRQDLPSSCSTKLWPIALYFSSHLLWYRWGTYAVFLTDLIPGEFRFLPLVLCSLFDLLNLIDAGIHLLGSEEAYPLVGMGWIPLIFLPCLVGVSLGWFLLLFVRIRTHSFTTHLKIKWLGYINKTQVTWQREEGYLKDKWHGEGGRVTEKQATWRSKTVYNKKKYKENVWIWQHKLIPRSHTVNERGYGICHI